MSTRGRAVGAQPGLAEQLGLALLADPVGAGLVAVLGQPDPLRAERAPTSRISFSTVAIVIVSQ